MRWLDKHFNFHATFEAKADFSFDEHLRHRTVGRFSGRRFSASATGIARAVSNCAASALNRFRPSSSRKMARGLGPGRRQHAGHFDELRPLLFLSKGRTPILISKFAFDGSDMTQKVDNRLEPQTPRRPAMVEYASKASSRISRSPGKSSTHARFSLANDDEIKEELSNLLQAPILYMNGHVAPN